MEELVLPFSWHSFCISIDVERLEATLVHNDHIQVIQRFGEVEDVVEDSLKFMTKGNLAGAKFVGVITEFEVFSEPFSVDELLEWTLCSKKVIHVADHTFCIKGFIPYKDCFKNNMFLLFALKTSFQPFITCFIL